ncbi:MAG: YidC/Oxa1 family insertase periplasmic-domain containing protein [Deltaproteobacteria bacterium]|nr:YidC/Oxa1 family insertase periplasmic-domain containing protein [Deltaproteobacteria bacterium]
MSTNSRLIVAVVLSLGVVLAFGLLGDLWKDDPGSSGGGAEVAGAAAPAPDAASVATAAPPGVPSATVAETAPVVSPAPVAAEVEVPAAPAAPVSAQVEVPAAPAAPVSATEAGSASAPAPAAPPAATSPAQERREKLENGAVTALVSSRRGALVSWKLKEPRFDETVAGGRVPLDLAATVDGAMGLYCYQAADVQGNYADVCPDEYELRREGEVVVLEGVPRPGARVRVRQTLQLGTPDNPYVVRRSIFLAPAAAGQVVQNLVLWTSVAHPALREKSSGGFFSPAANTQNGLCRVNGELGRTEREDVSSGSRSHGSIGWVGVEDMYFLSALGFEKKDPPNRRDFCVLDVLGAEDRQPLRATLQFAPMDLSGERVFELVGHLGPKSLDLLRSVAVLGGLDEAVDFGWFGPLCIVMLRIMEFFYSLVSIWGVAIILLTVLVKLVLLPLTHWSTMSMRRMSALKPLLDEINEKYKDDKARKNQAVMDLYRTHKVNPLGGCFPLLLQMPIWIALYRMLGASTELYHVSFLYLPDLTRADPYYVLPVVLGISMFVQQKMTPTTVDSAQAKVMLYGMPIMFTVFMLFLPSGLNLYIFTNTLLSIAQQQIYNRLVPLPAVHAAKGTAPAPKPAAAADTAAGGERRGRSRRKR